MLRKRLADSDLRIQSALPGRESRKVISLFGACQSTVAGQQLPVVSFRLSVLISDL
jgi:hypothetical protein